VPTSVYLVCGDDDAKLDAWRVRLRTRADDAAGPGSLEVFDARSCGPDAVAASLAAMMLTTSDRFVLVDGVDAWKPGDLEPLERELSAPAEGTILVMIARGKPPARLAKAVERAGGEQREYAAPKPWEMPRWAARRARECGLSLDGDAAKALVACVGARQQRLEREIEKLVLAAYPRTELSAEDVRELAACDAQDQAYDLADALVAGDRVEIFRVAERLIASGERPSGLMFPIVRRLRDVHRVAELLDAGVPESAAQRGMPRWAWKRTASQAKKADREALEGALSAFAELEVELRGGGAGVDEETAFSLALARGAAGRS
jgi:DNA polymerase III subunit delta